MKLHETSIRWDCRHYRGDKPCAQNRLCEGCTAYEPYTNRVAVIKIGALGDVIRTLCILPELRRRMPQAQITWVTSAAAMRMLAGHPMIDRLVEFTPSSQLALAAERFDLLISLDKEPGPCALAMTLAAGEKLGIGASPFGTPIPLNHQALDYFNLGLSDELKFRLNRKSYPRLVHEALGWEYDGQEYSLPLDEKAAAQVAGDLESVGFSEDRPRLGINVGAGAVFANKMWPVDRIAHLVGELHRRHPEIQVMLLGGQAEESLLADLHARLPFTLHAGARNDEQRFIALVDACDALFTGDTMAMHVAIARQRGVIAFFGPTCQQEIDLFGRGEKLIAHTPCSPCYKKTCDHNDHCLHAVTIDEAIAAILRVLRSTGRQSIPVKPQHIDIRMAG